MYTTTIVQTILAKVIVDLEARQLHLLIQTVEETAITERCT